MHKQHPFLSELVLCVQKAFHDYRSTVAYSCHAILLFLLTVYYSNIPTVFSNFLSISFFLLRLLFSSCLSGCYRSINETEDNHIVPLSVEKLSQQKIAAKLKVP